MPRPRLTWCFSVTMANRQVKSVDQRFGLELASRAIRVMQVRLRNIGYYCCWPLVEHGRRPVVIDCFVAADEVVVVVLGSCFDRAH